jgi:hypothetical protein
MNKTAGEVNHRKKPLKKECICGSQLRYEKGVWICLRKERFDKVINEGKTMENIIQIKGKIKRSEIVKALQMANITSNKLRIEYVSDRIYVLSLARNLTSENETHFYRSEEDAMAEFRKMRDEQLKELEGIDLEKLKKDGFINKEKEFYIPWEFMDDSGQYDLSVSQCRIL